MSVSIVTVWGVLCSTAAASTVYFDVDFGDPPHRVGSAPATGPGPETLTRVTRGQPRIVASHGPITDQAVLLNTTGNLSSFFGETLRFELGHGDPTYHVSFDVYTENLLGSTNHVVVILAMPQVSRFELTRDGFVFPGGIPYADRQRMHVDISVNVPENRRVVLLDGVLLYDGSIFAISDPQDVVAASFNLSLVSSTSLPDHSTNVVFDNIVISNGFVVPEPSIGLFVTAGLGIMGASRGRR